ncbi:hypothetical protein [Polaribacter sp. IC073]|uniref:hypothetical protein n=1 Tax=Polaribacter sp. IC073 TaxID=2508540 RepID=UPI0011BF4902|nr:hypothetical protein [Polaribacter sp. IC073]TXD45878.1 hypothetical protein ES045_15755 [Polaribacter sp. IC073]
MDYSKQIFRSHMVGKIINVPKPLTEPQEKMLADYLERSSGVGRTLTPKQDIVLTELKHKLNQSKKYSLSDGAKKTLRELMAFESRGVRLFMGSVQTKKGLLLEKEIRDVLSIEANDFLTECNERKANEWVTGITDFDVTNMDVVPDIKAAWSLLSFNNILEDKANELYLRQLDSYMDLYQKDKSLLIHVLLDTPVDLIERDIRNILNNPAYTTLSNELTDEGTEVMKSLIYNHTFTKKGIEDVINYAVRVHSDEYFEFNKTIFKDFKEKPLSERIHMIPHSFDKKRIEQRNECITLAREYMNTVKPINNFDINLLK